MKKYSLTKSILGSLWLSEGAIAHPDGSISKGFEMESLSNGLMEESFEGPISENFYAKLSDLLSKLPNYCDGHILLCRRKLQNSEVPGFVTKLYVFEKVQKAESYSHIHALLSELRLEPKALSKTAWLDLLAGMFGHSVTEGKYPDLIWEKDYIRVGERVVRTLSITELPQVTWKGCLQPIFENPCDFSLSIRFSIPDRAKIKRQLETKRRVSHALSITSSLEVRNIESNSVLNSSEETLERILVGKETLFEVSIAAMLIGSDSETLATARDFERVVSGIGNAGLFMEGIGTLPVFKSHIPGNKVLGIRKLPILSENLAHFLPLFHDYSRTNDQSTLALRSRSGEVSNLNLFSRENLNFNSFICGASGSGKSFLMNAILSSALKDEPTSRLCIFDVGGSYRRIIETQGGKSTSLSQAEANALISSFLRLYPTTSHGFFRAFIETLCGSGSHITHSHSVAIDDLLKEIEGERLEIRKLITNAMKRSERFYQDIAHWLKPHVGFDEIEMREDLIDLIKSPVSAFDFKELDSDPVLQKSTILLLTELLWKDLVNGKYTRTLIVFDEVWRFFAQSKGFLEEMYRTLRKYKAGIVSITQNLADYGDEGFAKMLFTNSFTKIFLQNGASAEYLKNTFDLPASDIERALSVTSKKPLYSEFFTLTPTMSQIFRLYPTQEFYSLANTENISIKPKERTKTE
jgi:conjugal transfer ATP-binding protein TraC